MRLTVTQPDTRWWNVKVVSEQSDYSLVRLSIGRGSRRSHAQCAVADAENFVATRPRLNPDSQNQVVATPTGGTISDITQIGIGLSVAMKIPLACNAMIAKIGEISSPPTVGIRFRKGRITGSTSIAMKAVAGL